jgi:hypothetical protein
MRGLAALVLTLAALTVVSAADAKQFVKLIALGDGGTWTELRGATFSPYVGVFRRVEERPTGGYLLVYPVLDRGLVAQPGRYFPGSGVLCSSWDRAEVGECRTVSVQIAAALDGAGLRAIVGEPTMLTRLDVAGREATLKSNGAAAVEIAFARWRLSRPLARRPRGCLTARATWSGPDAAARPTRFCITSRGVWKKGRFYAGLDATLSL